MDLPRPAHPLPLVAGVEPRREPVLGELRVPATAALPVIAAVCRMIVPAALHADTVMAGGGLEGWQCRWPPTAPPPSRS
ncbi:Na+/H+ antiporter NhaA [Streptomyces pimonensis]|uniref:Na+/H+ antiporter NhaA n=1 Tax=Streptomyces pimonensis TaxID=2860288 RepID=UPI00352873F8